MTITALQPTQSRTTECVRNSAGTLAKAETEATMHLPFRRFEPRRRGSMKHFALTLTPDAKGGTVSPAESPPRDGTPVKGPTDSGPLAPAAAFIVDAVHGTVPIFTIGRMIGAYFLAEIAPDRTCSAIAALRGDDRSWAMARINRKRIEIEDTSFGRARIIYEDETLGLYVLEIAPGHEIPPHAHQIMRERELVLDDGLILNGTPVRRGQAFDWKLGQIHGYRNPTDRTLRILCIDSPRFIPADEATISDPPPFEPLSPLGEYRHD